MDERSQWPPKVLAGVVASFSVLANINLPPDGNEDVLVLCESTV